MTIPVAAARVSPGDALTLGARSEHLRAGASGALSGPVTVVERLGGLTYLYVQATPSNLMIVHADGDVPVKVQDTVNVGLEPRLAHLFRADGVAPCPLKRSRSPVCDGPERRFRVESDSKLLCPWRQPSSSSCLICQHKGHDGRTKVTRSFVLFPASTGRP
jgi:TOBE domain